MAWKGARRSCNGARRAWKGARRALACIPPTHCWCWMGPGGRAGRCSMWVASAAAAAQPLQLVWAASCAELQPSVGASSIHAAVAQPADPPPLPPRCPRRRAWRLCCCRRAAQQSWSSCRLRLRPPAPRRPPPRTAPPSAHPQRLPAPAAQPPTTAIPLRPSAAATSAAARAALKTAGMAVSTSVWSQWQGACPPARPWHARCACWSRPPAAAARRAAARCARRYCVRWPAWWSSRQARGRGRPRGGAARPCQQLLCEPHTCTQRPSPSRRLSHRWLRCAMHESAGGEWPPLPLCCRRHDSTRRSGPALRRQRRGSPTRERNLDSAKIQAAP